MEHFVFYRKYRPNSFKEVQGQEFIIKTLQNSIINNNLSHTYIFSGPRGTGKTSIAKIFSKAINCLSSQNGDCCNGCKNCISINKHENVDIIEIDAASNNGVGEIRNIIDNIFYLPMTLKKKIYIIDEAHMLTSFAWNAFLKTLEDTPKNLIFIFATTEQHKIPATIISRCQRYNFAKISTSNLISYIKNICTLEKIMIDEESVKKISYLSDGSLRDAMSILDQLSTFTSKNIAINDVNKVFGLVDIYAKLELLENIVASNIDKTIKIVDNFDESGIDLYQLSIEIIEMILDKIIYEKTKNFKLLKIIPITHVNFIEAQPRILFQFVNIWEEAMLQIKSHSNSKFFFELACLNSSRLFNFDEKKDTSNLIFESLKKNTTSSYDVSKKNIINPNNKSINIEPNINILKPIDNQKIKDKETPKIETMEIKVNNNETNIKSNLDSNSSEKNVNKEGVNILSKDDITNIVKKSLKMKNIDLPSINFSEFKNISEEVFSNIKEHNIGANKILNSINNVEENSVNISSNILNETKTPPITSQNNINTPLPLNLKTKDKFKTENEFKEETLFSVSDDSKNDNENKIFIKPKVMQEISNNSHSNNTDQNDYSLLFNQIAFNKIDEEKERLNKILMNIKDNVPISPEEGYFVDSLKIIIASQNGFVVLFDDDISAKNLNIESSEPKFINYVKNKFGRVFKVLAVNKNMVINFTQTYKENVANKNKLFDVNIDDLFNISETKEISNKDIAIELLGNLIKE